MYLFFTRVNSVHPGAIKTPMLDDLWSEEFEKQVMATIPLGYVATSDDVKNPVLFLATDEARYITGMEIVVDGGITAG